MFPYTPVTPASCHSSDGDHALSTNVHNEDFSHGFETIGSQPPAPIRRLKNYINVERSLLLRRNSSTTRRPMDLRIARGLASHH